MAKCPFIPDSFDPPVRFETRHFYFRVLDSSVAAPDYEAVMSSLSRLKGIFGPDFDWPKPDMTFNESLQSLKVHEREFELRQAFAYSVFDPMLSKCLGSVYIDPSRSPHYDCEVYLWIRTDSQTQDELLFNTVQNWLKTCWPFDKAAFPGRTLSWEEWQQALIGSRAG
ncbi:hypothetical protein CWB99_11295 [Pseudoalteromonas rubra]|uniref:Uncharacterized protein n=1 Tax=Pseudoalteromonas rubra TaxID=43658 RepID=A0A5S3WL84_9GAMM|nr:hypothetical protein [Pseudoalteromonas rubra]TMP28491.1 hypothetical protein CWB99_11295 [Pseudoalteromonas rubra]TMP30459.1 hypothetical protein CWC00_16415 [Pseudoalteromonas rubra]